MVKIPDIPTSRKRLDTTQLATPTLADVPDIGGAVKEFGDILEKRRLKQVAADASVKSTEFYTQELMRAAELKNTTTRDDVGTLTERVLEGFDDRSEAFLGTIEDEEERLAIQARISADRRNIASNVISSQLAQEKVFAGVDANSNINSLVSAVQADSTQLNEALKKHEGNMAALKPRLGATAANKLLVDGNKKIIKSAINGMMISDPNKLVVELSDEDSDLSKLAGADRKTFLEQARTQAKNQAENARLKRIAAESMANAELTEKVIANSPDALAAIDEQEAQGGNKEFLDSLRKTLFKLNPLTPDEQNDAYVKHFDALMNLELKTEEGKTKVGNNDITLPDLVRFQQELLKDSARGVKGLGAIIRQTSKALVEKAKKETGFDDPGFDGLFPEAFEVADEPLDPGYQIIQNHLEDSDQVGNNALKVKMFSDLIEMTDALPESVRGNKSEFRKSMKEIADQIVQDEVEFEANKGKVVKGKKPSKKPDDKDTMTKKESINPTTNTKRVQTFKGGKLVMTEFFDTVTGELLRTDR